MIRIAIRVIINAAALWVAARFIDGITLTEDVGSILFVAIVFGLINAFIRPVVLVLTFPALILTLGLFTLVINAAMLGATAWLEALAPEPRATRPIEVPDPPPPASVAPEKPSKSRQISWGW